MDTEFGTIQVKLLTEKGCDDDICGWYKVSEFKPRQDDDLAEKTKSWNYAMRLVPVDSSSEKSSKQKHGFEIIVLRKKERGSLGFELPRNGVVHISEAINGKDDGMRLEDSGPFQRRSHFLRRSSDGLTNSDGDIRWSSGLDDSGLHTSFLRSSRNRRSTRDSRMLANTNLGTLSIAQPYAPSTVATDIQYTRESYMATVQQRDTEEENKLSCEKVLAYRQSALQRKSTITGCSGEMNYSKIFPKTAPVRYNKSALPESEIKDSDDDTSTVLLLPASKTSSLSSTNEKPERPMFPKTPLDEPFGSLLDTDETGIIKQSKKFGYSKSFIEFPRESMESDIDYTPKMQYGSKLDIAGPSWREISWEERMDDESDSYIELEGSILSVKDLRSENELEIVVYSPSDDKSAQSDNSRSNSSGNEQTLRYVSIPRQKIQDFLTKGIGVKNQSFIEDNDANKVKQISVKRKP
ncbi:uncharacterized protein LOC111048612 isoform X3 [Nilaparvata lugens]|nr:uncharacterized protein LOC111048612 isoform X3 [Nilaparvata lugens]